MNKDRDIKINKRHLFRPYHSHWGKEDKEIKNKKNQRNIMHSIINAKS